jgi:hypothetical protein
MKDATELVKVWTIDVNPSSVLTIATVITMTAYFIYIVFSMSVYTNDDDVGGGTLPSMSWMIAYSRGTTITFTLMVFVHGYALMSYLVIVSEYIGIMSYQFRAIAGSAFIYWLSLILVSYLPLDGNENPHNIFAVMGFTFALCTVYLHKHTFIVFKNNSMVPRIDLNVTDKTLAFSELFLIISISILGGLFWFMDIVIAEYVFVGLILVDKYVKIRILEKAGLLNTKGAKLEYVYYSPPNNARTGAYTTPEFNF